MEIENIISFKWFVFCFVFMVAIIEFVFIPVVNESFSSELFMYVFILETSFRLMYCVMFLWVVTGYFVEDDSGEQEVDIEVVGGASEVKDVEKVIEKQPIIIGADAIRAYERHVDMEYYRKRLKDTMG